MPAFSPFSLIRRIAEDMDRMFEGFPFVDRLSPSAWMEGFTPKVDILKQDGKLLVRADLPGVDLKDVTVEISDDAIVIEGERTYEHEEDKEGVYRVERSYGRFHREIPLPENVKVDTATATFKNGVLEIAIEAPQMENRRRIEVKSEEQPQQAQQTLTSSPAETKAETTEPTEQPGSKAA
jgi:HSP20 family protein